MKAKIKISVMLLCMIFLFCSCTVQEKMNPMLFIQRFTDTSGNEFSIEESFDDNGRYIIFFCDKNGEKYACELQTDSFGNIKKICLAGNNTSKAEPFEYLFKNVLDVYAPNENPDEIIPDLFKNKWNYHSTQWYDYSCIVSDEGIFASIENKKLATESDARLTLKQSDIIYP